MEKEVLFLIFLGFISISLADRILFQKQSYTRDRAQFCCEKYGMTLFKIFSQADSDYLESFLRTVPGLNEIWLGLFYNSSVVPSERYFWADRQVPIWPDFDNATIDPIVQLENQTTNETLCTKAVLGSGSGFTWTNASCEEKLAYGCQAGVNITSIPLTVTDAECPKLLKLTGKELVRNSNPVVGGAINHGYFDLHNKIYEMGTQIASHIVKYTSDCALHCLSNALCTDAIIVSELLCILYK